MNANKSSKQPRSKRQIRNPKSAKALEKSIGATVKQILQYSGAVLWKNWGGPLSPPGLPDYVGVIKVPVHQLILSGITDVGLFFAIETKAPGRMPTKDVLNDPTKQTKTLANQISFIEKIRNSGGIAFFCDSVECLVENFQAAGIKLPVLGFFNTKPED